MKVALATRAGLVLDVDDRFDAWQMRRQSATVRAPFLRRSRSDRTRSAISTALSVSGSSGRASTACDIQRDHIFRTFATIAARHMWTASWQALFCALNDLVSCGHMSGLLSRDKCPLALMKSDDRGPYQSDELFAHVARRAIPNLRW
jgi:hypothetical protein